jgi:hypothetical protein
LRESLGPARHEGSEFTHRRPAIAFARVGGPAFNISSRCVAAHALNTVRNSAQFSVLDGFVSARFFRPGIPANRLKKTSGIAADELFYVKPLDPTFRGPYRTSETQTMYKHLPAFYGAIVLAASLGVPGTAIAVPPPPPCTTAPGLDVDLAPNSLWPPNHLLVDITPTVNVTVTCDPSVSVTLVSITSNEPENGLGDGNGAPDIVIIDDLNFQLRAERSGLGSGRIYTVCYAATDLAGNQTTACEVVVVPANRSPAAP